MIIRSIRLKNIKSYGDGPDGNGVTVHFEPLLDVEIFRRCSKELKPVIGREAGIQQQAP